MRLFCFDAFVAANAICKTVNVLGDDYPERNGHYKIIDDHVPWAPEKPMFKHVSNNWYIFWNIEMEWMIGQIYYEGAFETCK